MSTALAAAHAAQEGRPALLAAAKPIYQGLACRESGTDFKARP